MPLPQVLGRIFDPMGCGQCVAGRALYVVFAQKGASQFARETPLSDEELAAMGEAEIDKEEDEDMKFLCVNAKTRARNFMREYRELSEYFIWQHERLDWTQRTEKRRAF